ncbi:MAG: peptidoglycan DD-metalloendopeptidase family protein [Clostridium sp.]|nr:peptidoglycan DD-metalloendopeptidase family protein [Clostridium sp.]
MSLNAHIINIYRSFIKAVFIVILLFSFSSNAFCSQNHIEKKRKETHAKVLRLKRLETIETNKLYKNQQKLENAQKNLNTTKKQYQSAEQQLSEAEKNLNATMQDYSETEFQSKNRIRQIFKKQRKGMFQLLLSTTDINTFLDRIYYQNIITKKDKKRLAYLKEKSRRIAILRNQIEQQKTIIAYSIKNINAQQQYIQGAISQNESSIQKYRTNRAYYEKAERELARQSEALSKMISRNTQGTTVKVVSGFMKPIAGPITSPFGYRTHPIFKRTIYHSGIDIGGINGGKIRASNSGKVIYSGWYGGYGKVVIIDHGIINGKPISTLYAHMSGYTVSAGQNVLKGQVIGYEGSTGYSTGPHCHFEVRVNGKPQNPLNYI